jgi:hypothetical protein
MNRVGNRPTPGDTDELRDGYVLFLEEAGVRRWLDERGPGPAFRRA